MRIISDFRDYYDCGQAYGQDANVLYLRSRDILNNTALGFKLPRSHWCSSYDRLTYSSVVIGFCGKAYLNLIMSVGFGTDKFCYNIEDVDKYVEEHCSNKEKDKYWIGKKKYRWQKDGRNNIKLLFNREEFCQRHDHLFIEHKCPIFVVRHKDYRDSEYETILNPNLREYEFFRVIEPYTTYQELSMYFSGPLTAPEKPIPPISDKDMVEIKGFDKKWSFRKEPSK